MVLLQERNLIAFEEAEALKETAAHLPKLAGYES
jgi:hypothetical protein